MRINSPYITGSATITGNLCVQGTILGTITGVASTASYAETLDGLDSTQFVQTGSFNSYTSSASSSIGSLSGSVATTTSGLSSSIGSLSSSVATTTSGLGGRITTIEGRYATTGSNTFIGNQVITGSLYITTDLIVQGSSSLQNITASAVSIGTNTVILNTDTPAVRFAGISVQDSGSNAGVTGSIFWDGLCNKWVYSNPSGIGYSGGMLLSGPRTATLGSESPLTCNYIAKSGGGDHLYDSCIQEVSGSVTIGGTLCTSGVVCGASGIFSSTSYSNLYLDGTNASGWGNNIAFRSQGTDFGYVGSIGSLVGSTTKDMTIWSTTGNGFRVYTNGNNPRLCIDSNGISTFACQVCAPIVSVGSCLLINQTSSLLEVTTKVEMSGIGDATAISQASYNVFANHGANCTWIGYLNFNKSRGTTQGSVTAVVNGDRLGMVRFSGADGSERIRSAEIYSEVDGTVSKCCVPGRIIFATTGNNLDGPIERFRITGAGCVGVGRCCVEFTLDVNGDIALNRQNRLHFASSNVGDRCRSFLAGDYNNNIFVCGPSGNAIAAFMYTGTVCTYNLLNAAGGVKFGSGASTLNYYEQGTFSPAFAGSTSGCGVPSGGNAALGYYTRIGNQVFITVAVNSATFPSYSGDLKMYLPFTAWDGGGLNSVTYHGPPIYFYPLPNWGSSYCINDITPYILGATNYINFNIYGLGTDRQNAVTSANTNLSGTAGIYTRFSINYTAV